MSTRDYTEFFDFQAADAATVRAVHHDFAKGLARDMAAAGVGPSKTEQATERLWNAMSQPVRHYHSPVHVLSMFDHARAAALALTEADRLAVWYHDSVYDPTATNGHNEAASAQLLRSDLAGEPIDRAVLDRAAATIRSTAEHTRDDLPPEFHPVLDLDLAGFTAPPEVFDRQSAALRLEYPGMPNGQYARATADFLRTLLARERIFRTPAFAPREQIARGQIRREIQRLDARAR